MHLGMVKVAVGTKGPVCFEGTADFFSGPSNKTMVTVRPSGLYGGRTVSVDTLQTILCGLDKATWLTRAC